MSEMTRRDHYICAYIAQGKTYDQAKMIFEMECEHNPGLGDTALSAAGEKVECAEGQPAPLFSPTIITTPQTFTWSWGEQVAP